MTAAANLADLAPVISRNYAGAQQIGVDGTTLSNLASGRFYQLDLSTAARTVNLPLVSSIPDGWSVVVRAINVAPGFQLSWVAAETGKTIAFRGWTGQNFHLIGRGEVFRFTWIAGLDLWLAECLVQPGRVAVSGTHTAATYANGIAGSWGLIALNTINAGDASQIPSFQLNSSRIRIPIVGSFGVSLSYYSWASDANTATHYIAPCHALGNTYDTSLAYDNKNVTGSQAQFINISYSNVYNPGEFVGIYSLVSNVYLYYYLANSLCNVVLTGR